MSTYTANSQLTLVEVAKRTLNGQMLPIAEVLNLENPIIQQAPWLEANDMFSNVTTQRYSLPAGAFRMINAGVPLEHSTTAQIRDQMGFLETYAEHDQLLVDSMPSPGTFRNDENRAFIEGLGQTFADTLFYGNAVVDPEKWTGIAPRLATLNTTNVQGCSGTGSDLSSIYFVTWDPSLCHLIYPRGSSGGIKHEDLGKNTLTDSGYRYEIYRDHFMLYCGLVIRNIRAVGRVCNIETSGSSNLFDEDVVIRVKNSMLYQGKRSVAYCNQTILSQIEIQIKNKSNVFMYTQNPFGDGQVPSILGVPLYVCENIKNTEDAIS